jgi:hypothetical protein
MEITSDLTLREARDLFYKAHGFPENGRVSKDKWSLISCRDLKIYLPNFEWRKKALPFHDLHHILTGYELCPTGEFQIAAWEFAAGKYPNIFTTCFCVPLVSMGAILIPSRQFRAFIRGRRSRTLYKGHTYEQLLDMTVGEVRDEILPREGYRANLSDFLNYIKLVLLSSVVIVSPFLLVLFFYLEVK